MSIPLADMFQVYSMPIVYTYTEESEGSGKLLLKASILLARAKVPLSDVHVVYHGESDSNFRRWLQQQGVILHKHDPAWRKSIDSMFRNGDVTKSHLFQHAGNYFGTWQRIDIPKFINEVRD